MAISPQEAKSMITENHEYYIDSQLRSLKGEPCTIVLFDEDVDLPNKDRLESKYKAVGWKRAEIKKQPFVVRFRAEGKLVEQERIRTVMVFEP